MDGLRILMNCASYTGVGDWYRAYHLGRELTALGQRVTLVSLSPHERWRSRLGITGGMEHLECANWGNAPLGHHGDGPLDIAARCGHLLRRRYDLVHSFSYYLNANLPAFMLRRLRGYVFVSDWCDWFSRGMDMGRFAGRPGLARAIGAWEDAVRRRAQGVTAISRALQGRCLKIGCPPGSVLYLPGGAPAQSVTPQDQPECRARCGLPQDAQVAAYLGAPYAQEFSHYIEAAKRLAGQRPQLRLLFIGSPRPEIKDLVEQAGLTDRTIFAGKVTDADLPCWLGCADFFMLPMTDNPYHQSRWPNKIGEYLAAGRPVLASAVGEVKELLSNNPVGVLTGNDSTEIAERMAGLWDDAPGRQRMGQAARALAEGPLSWASLAQELLEFYRRLLANQRRDA